MLLLFQVGLNLKSKHHLRLNYSNLEPHIIKAITDTKTHLRHFGINDDEALPSGNERYISELKSELKSEREFYIFYKGELEYRLLEKSILPTELRVDKFLRKSFLYLNGHHRYFRAHLLKEYVVKLGKKKSFFHYISIPNWPNKNVDSLMEEVKIISKPSPRWTDRYKLKKAKLFSKGENPALNKAIDKVLTSGKISEQTIFNLASSEKLVIVHKYGEGFSDVYRKQQTERKSLSDQLEKDKKSESKAAKKRVPILEKKLSQLNENYIISPINYSLAKAGFVKLFNKSNHIYILPLSQVPDKYHNNVNSYLEDEIIPQADAYLTKVKQESEYLDGFEGGLKYMIIAHTIPINEMQFYQQERSLEVSSKTLAKVLFTSFLENENENITSIYINDLVRNVDFKSQLKSSTKTGEYLLSNFDTLKSILWQDYKIEIAKPNTLITLTDQNIDDIVNKMIKVSNFSKPHLIKGVLKERIKFYKELNEELNKLKKE